WGLYHGTLLVADRRTRAWRARRLVFRAPAARWAWAVASAFLTFHAVTLGWVLFRADSIGRALQLLTALATDPRPGLAAAWVPRFALLALPLALIDGAQLWPGDLEVVHRFPWPARTAVYALLAAVIALAGEDFGFDFIYFRF